MNKKLLALLLAILMVAMSAVAMADTQTSIKITKTYESDIDGDKITQTVPSETLTFTATFTGYKDAADEADPDVTTENMTATQSVAAGTNSYEVTFTPDIDNFSQAGYYTFRVTEEGQSIQGEEYNSKGASSFDFVVLVGYDAAGDLEITDVQFVTKTDTQDAKISGFTNNYATGEFQIKKTMSGNQADVNDTFTVTLTVSAYGSNKLDPAFTDITVNGETVSPKTQGTHVYDVTIGKDQLLTVSGIPVGAQVKVEETGKTGKDGIEYTATYSDSNLDAVKTDSQTAPTITVVAAGTAKVGIHNFRDSSIDTGVTTDSMPYILLMAFVAILAVAFVAKKRTVKE